MVPSVPRALGMSSAVPEPEETPPASLRDDTLSSSRIQIVLLGFVSILLALLTASTFAVVSHVFSRITPGIERDLERKAAVGASKLAAQTDLMLAIGDGAELESAFKLFAEDSDIAMLVAVGSEGATLATYGTSPYSTVDLFGGPPNRSRHLGRYIVAWSEASVEGVAVGRVATVVSTERLEDGESLRRLMLGIVGLGAVGGLILSVGFVRLYVVPLKRVTNQAFDRLERAGRELAAKQRLEQELEIGARIQTCILPSRMGTADLDVAGTMKPADEVGGDYYDAFSAGGAWWLAIGDVAGHGLPSGLVMLMTQSALGALARELPNAMPSSVLAAVNKLLFDNIRHRLGNSEHVTLSLFKYLRDGRFCFAGAHEEIVVFRARTGSCELIETPGPWLGIVPDIAHSLSDRALQLQESDVMVLYTDGVTEARNAAGKQFGLERMMDIVRAHSRESAEQIKSRIIEAVEAWMAAREDDVTVVVVRRVSSKASQ